jgi:DNA-binding SARP family transcriptional activator
VEAPTAIGAAKPCGCDATIRLALRLLGDFELTATSHPATVGWSGRRILAFLALRRGSVGREFLARALWPDLPEQRLHAYLRSALWRLRKSCPGVVEASANEVRLGGHVAVDVWHSLDISRQLIDRSTHMQPEQLGQALQVNLHDDLLPGWLEEEWIRIERERFRQLRLHSLEMLCERLTSAGWHGAAVDAGIAAVAADPLRESARRVLIGAFLAEGNVHLAIAEFDAYRRLLQGEFRCEPSPELRQLVGFAQGRRWAGTAGRAIES